MQTQIHQIHQGDVLEVLKTLPDNYFDACLLPTGVVNHFSNEQVPELVRQVHRVLRPDAPPLGSYSDGLARLLLPPERPLKEILFKDTPPPEIRAWAIESVRRSNFRRILLPFSGSGSEMLGALLAGWDEVQGIELSAEDVAIAQAHIARNCPASTGHITPYPSASRAVGQDAQGRAAADQPCTLANRL